MPYGLIRVRNEIACRGIPTGCPTGYDTPERGKLQGNLQNLCKLWGSSDKMRIAHRAKLCYNNEKGVIFHGS